MALLGSDFGNWLIFVEESRFFFFIYNHVRKKSTKMELQRELSYRQPDGYLGEPFWLSFFLSVAFDQHSKGPQWNPVGSCPSVDIKLVEGLRNLMSMGGQLPIRFHLGPFHKLVCKGGHQVNIKIRTLKTEKITGMGFWLQTNKITSGNACYLK